MMVIMTRSKQNMTMLTCGKAAMTNDSMVIMMIMSARMMVMALTAANVDVAAVSFVDVVVMVVAVVFSSCFGWCAC